MKLRETGNRKPQFKMQTFRKQKLEIADDKSSKHELDGQSDVFLCQVRLQSQSSVSGS